MTVTGEYVPVTRCGHGVSWVPVTDHQSSPSMYSDPGAPEVIPGDEARSRFYEAYRRQSNRFDKELKEYNKELNITLLFVRLVAVYLASDEGRTIGKSLTLDQNHSPSVRVIRCRRLNLPETGTEHQSSSRME